MTDRAPMPAETPGLRRRMLLLFHLELCVNPHGNSADPQAHRGEGPCWRALRVVDDTAGDLDDIITDLDQRAADIRRDTAARQANRANLEAALGIIPPAIDGDIAPALERAR